MNVTTNPLEALRPVTQVDKLVSKTPSVQDDGFLDAMKQALSTTSKLQADSGRLSREFTLENPTVGLEETILAGVKSNIAFQATLHSRNRIVQAYTDVMNMQVCNCTIHVGQVDVTKSATHVAGELFRADRIGDSSESFLAGLHLRLEALLAQLVQVGRSQGPRTMVERQD